MGAKLWQDHGPVLRAGFDTWGSVPELRPFWETITTQFVDAAAEQIKAARSAARAERAAQREGDGDGVDPDERALLLHGVLGCGALTLRQELTTTLTTVFLRTIYGTDSPSATRQAARLQ